MKTENKNTMPRLWWLNPWSHAMRAYRIANMLSEALQQQKREKDVMRWYVLEQYNDDLYSDRAKKTQPNKKHRRFINKHQDDIRRGLRTK